MDNNCSPKITILLANPRGFCAGVERAIEIVNRALLKYKTPIYVNHEIVHNTYVIHNLKKRGVIFVDNISEVPNHSVIIFSAHGVSNKVERESKLKHLKIIDATCPLVKKVHIQGKQFDKDKRKIILIGHHNHPEVQATKGRISQEIFIVEKLCDIDKIPYSRKDPISYITQTTLSVDDTKKIISNIKIKFPNIKGPDLNHICYATQNRQYTVKKISALADTIFVIGAKNSSNSNRLCEIAKNYGVKSYLLDGQEDRIKDLLIYTRVLGITAGASTPEILIDRLVKKIAKIRKIKVINVNGVKENITFKIPRELQNI